MDIIDNIYGKLCGDGGNCHGLKFRPFNLKCHCTKNFQLGQKITLPNGQESWITSIKWTFRGGYTLSCAGKDTRVLCASARRSQSAKVKDLAYTKINTEIAKLKNDISDGEFQALKGEKGDKGEQGEKGDKGDAGERGSDGFSPTVEVSENTDNSYVLKITDKNGSFETPNLLKNIIIDSMLSEISENPVQNKVITLKLKEFDGMFAEIKKLIEELKVMLGEEDKTSGTITINFAGNNCSLNGKMEVSE